MTTTFAELGLNEQILAGVADLGFVEPTPVQEQAIPLVLAGRDLVASAQTGTGKTAAFVLPTLQLIAEAAEGIVRNERPFGVEPTEAGDASSGDEEAHADDGSAKGENAQETETAAASRQGADDAQASGPEDANPTDVPADDAREDASYVSSRKVLPDLVDDSGDSISVPADKLMSHDEPSRPGAAPRRRRRRRHKKKSAASAEEAAAKDAPTVAGTRAPAEPRDLAGTPARRRRRRRKKTERATKAEPLPTLDSPAVPLALVVTPTRELAQQIEHVTTVVCKHTGQRSVIVMGGTRFDRQLRELERGCDLLVATPGRLLDLMERHYVDLSQVRVLVLDEADRMLDMGFWPSVRRILQALPEHRQNLLFSATIPPSIKGTIDAMLSDPATVEIARVGQTADTVEEHLMPVTQGQKIQLLEALVRTGGAEEGSVLERVLVFCRTKRRVDDVSKSLQASGFKVEVMHADRRQEAREKALRRFRDGEVQVLVATDVMSRGIDVSGIDAVVNFDVPMDPEDYVHRIGRTGRAGATGHAYTFMAPDEVTPLREIEYFTKKLVPVWDLSGFAYDSGRIMPQTGRSTTKTARTMFAGSRSRGRGPSGGRYGRHY